MTDHTPSGLPQPQTVPIINGEPATARSLLDALIDIYDDAQNNPPEHRCYVESAWPDVLKEARTFLSSAPAVETVAVQEAKGIPTEVGIAWQSGNTWPNERKAVTVDGHAWYRHDHPSVRPLPVAPKAEPRITEAEARILTEGMHRFAIQEEKNRARALIAALATPQADSAQPVADRSAEPVALSTLTVPIPLGDAQHLLAWMDERFGNADGTDWHDENAASVADGLNAAVQKFKRAHPAAASAPSLQGEPVAYREWLGKLGGGWRYFDEYEGLPAGGVLTDRHEPLYALSQGKRQSEGAEPVAPNVEPDTCIDDASFALAQTMGAQPVGADPNFKEWFNDAQNPTLRSAWQAGREFGRGDTVFVPPRAIPAEQAAPTAPLMRAALIEAKAVLEMEDVYPDLLEQIRAALAAHPHEAADRSAEAISDERIDEALEAWFASGPVGADQKTDRTRMRAAIDAAMGTPAAAEPGKGDGK